MPCARSRPRGCVPQTRRAIPAGPCRRARRPRWESRGRVSRRRPAGSYPVSGPSARLERPVAVAGCGRENVGRCAAAAFERRAGCGTAFRHRTELRKPGPHTRLGSPAGSPGLAAGARARRALSRRGPLATPFLRPRRRRPRVHQRAVSSSPMRCSGPPPSAASTRISSGPGDRGSFRSRRPRRCRTGPLSLGPGREARPRPWE